ncbi:MAG: dinitrogenase iron-molybdenum cofactor biosynthesis protein [Planctomycetes bacterium]|jgi:predicted Fe-Mo cluster-binding NifX family protein|nr:dinitrogenase iron-molybdenum cofactor biosynthesis protein [Planctomycetota bacterium]
MKIAISSTGESPEAEIAEVFGRCPYFILAEVEDKKVKKITAVKNESIDLPGGAGLAAAKLVAAKGANAVIASNVGPRTLEVLRQFNIKIVTARGRVSQAIEDFIKKHG